MPSHKAAEACRRALGKPQLKVMRFADEYGRVQEVGSRFQAAEKRPEQRLTAQAWKVQQSGKRLPSERINPLVNVLDMVVLASLSRLVIEDVWIKAADGEHAQWVLDEHRSLRSGPGNCLTGC